MKFTFTKFTKASIEYGLVFTFFRLKSIFDNRFFSSRLFYLTLVNLKCLSVCHSFFANIIFLCQNPD